MRITNLTENSGIYTSNVYLVRGTWNAIDDVNTLVDVGRDIRVIQALRDAGTGVGKKKLDRVLLTHSHYDHCEVLAKVKDTFSPEVYAVSSAPKQVDVILRNHQTLRLGDMDFEVILCGAHSSDSACFYSHDSGVLFSGDTPLIAQCSDVEYTEAYADTLRYLVSCGITTIYPGHGAPIVGHCNALLKSTLQNLYGEVV